MLYREDNKNMEFWNCIERRPVILPAWVRHPGCIPRGACPPLFSWTIKLWDDRLRWTQGIRLRKWSPVAPIPSRLPAGWRPAGQASWCHPVYHAASFPQFCYSAGVGVNAKSAWLSLGISDRIFLIPEFLTQWTKSSLTESFNRFGIIAGLASRSIPSKFWALISGLL